MNCNEREEINFQKIVYLSYYMYQACIIFYPIFIKVNLLLDALLFVTSYSCKIFVNVILLHCFVFVTVYSCIIYK